MPLPNLDQGLMKDEMEVFPKNITIMETLTDVQHEGELDSNLYWLYCLDSGME